MKSVVDEQDYEGMSEEDLCGEEDVYQEHKSDGGMFQDNLYDEEELNGGNFEDDVYKEEELDGGLFEEDGMRKKMHMKMRVVI